ncbi:hypothetical protein CAMRE0001_1972 [Campylobacter rectus RM3267]|uniref:Uncharacterized protein n=1 Tax=Campylobacter rectus RM3267 TaxID=553218 RepID=B9CYX9_CAMRE|nr:hypothetical protein CAMRE0001_1972 [Campylobacter rectus RM3267]
MDSYFYQNLSFKIWAKFSINFIKNKFSTAAVFAVRGRKY